MKKTTIITIGYFILTLLFCVGMRIVADAINDDRFSAFSFRSNEEAYEPYLFQLTEHRIQPVVSIEGGEDNWLFEDKSLFVRIEVDFVDDEKDCSIAYPEGLVSIRQNSGKLVVEPSGEFQKKSNAYFSPLYNTEGEPDINYHANDSVYSYSIKHLDGSIEKIEEEMDLSETRMVHIRLKTTRVLLSAILHRNHDLTVRNMVARQFKCQLFGRLALTDSCKINNLDVQGDIHVWLDNTRIGKLNLKCITDTPESFNLLNMLDGKESLVDTLVITGGSNEYSLDKKMFHTIIVEPSPGETMNVKVSGIDKRIVLKDDASSVPMKKVDKEGVKHK